MAKKLFVKLQTPFIELPVTAIDVAGNSSTIKVGFKRYTLEQLEKEAETRGKAVVEETDLAFLLKEILYIKDAVLEVYEGDKYLEDLKVPDTRTVTKTDFYETAMEALEVLLGHYLNSAPWKSSLITAYSSAITNVSNLQEAKSKN